MIKTQKAGRPVGRMEAVLLIAAGVSVVLTLTGQVDGVALILLLTVGYLAWLARGVIAQAGRFRPVEPPSVWWITLLGNLALMAVGLGAFGWYLAGAGARAWVPFLVFIAGFIALRQWRNGRVAQLYAWRTPALVLIQQGEYKKLIRELESAATAGRGHPDKLAMVALAYIELNKLDRAETLLAQAQATAPDFASVNGALSALRRHQARYAEAAAAARRALAFEDNPNSAYYLGLCEYLAGQVDAAAVTLQAVIDHPALLRQGQVIGGYVLGQAAEEMGDEAAARQWYARMAEAAPKALPSLREEARRHKQTAYGETFKDLVRAIERLIARRSLAVIPGVAEETGEW